MFACGMVMQCLIAIAGSIPRPPQFGFRILWYDDNNGFLNFVLLFIDMISNSVLAGLQIYSGRVSIYKNIKKRWSLRGG